MQSPFAVQGSIFTGFRIRHRHLLGAILCGSAGKKIHLQCGKPGLDPWLGKILWRRERLPTPVFWTGEFYTVHEVTKSQTWLSDFHSTGLHVAQLVKNPPAMWEAWVWSLGWEDPLEKGKATHSRFWPGKFHGLYSPWGSKESDTDEDEWLSFHRMWHQKTMVGEWRSKAGKRKKPIKREFTRQTSPRTGKSQFCGETLWYRAEMLQIYLRRQVIASQLVIRHHLRTAPIVTDTSGLPSDGRVILWLERKH